MVFNRFPSFICSWRIIFTSLLVIYTISIASAGNSGINDRLKVELLALGFPNGELPVLTPAFGNYVDVVEVKKFLYLSSAAPQTPASTYVKGRVPNEVSFDQAINASKLACVRQINRLKTYLGDLNKVKKIIFVKGKIVTQQDFINHTAIVDGCSGLLVNVFGADIGKHARATDGVYSLPLNVTLEIELIAEKK